MRPHCTSHHIYQLFFISQNILLSKIKTAFALIFKGNITQRISAFILVQIDAELGLEIQKSLKYSKKHCAFLCYKFMSFLF